MKKVILLLFLFVPFMAFSQSKENKVKLEEFEKQGVYKVDGSNIVVSRVLENIEGTKDELYLKVKNYFARAYRDANSVLQVDDKEAGLLIGKGLYSDCFGYKANITVPVVYSAYHVESRY